MQRLCRPHRLVCALQGAITDKVNEVMRGHIQV